MIDRDGNEYPDPPRDPVERAKWKTIYFARNYGIGKDRMNASLETMARLDAFMKKKRIYIWALRVQLLYTFASLGWMIHAPSRTHVVYFISSVVWGLVMIMLPPKLR